jgi:hypothetical protein
MCHLQKVFPLKFNFLINWVTKIVQPTLPTNQNPLLNKDNIPHNISDINENSQINPSMINIMPSDNSICIQKAALDNAIKATPTLVSRLYLNIHIDF